MVDDLGHPDKRAQPTFREVTSLEEEKIQSCKLQDGMKQNDVQILKPFCP
jgi:hypothetical protein